MPSSQVKVLGALVDRGSMSGHLTAESYLPTLKPTARVADCISELLVRIDVAEWWRNHAKHL